MDIIAAEQPRLSLDAFICDWNRIYRVQCKEKVQDVLISKEVIEPHDTHTVFIAL